MGKTVTGFAPRAFERPDFIHSYQNYFEKLSKWEQLKRTFNGQTPSNVYWPITKDPLFFNSNKKILGALGYSKTIGDLLHAISPGHAITSCNGQSYEDPYYLQTGLNLGHNEQQFAYALSSRRHAISLMFCITPQQILDDMETRNRSSGLWMLDQVIIHRGHSVLQLGYSRDQGKNRDTIKELFSIIKSTNRLIEQEAYDEANSYFINQMDIFDEKYLSHAPQRQAPNAAPQMMGQ